MIKKQFVFALSLFVILMSMNTVSAQVTFIHNKELIGENTDDLFGWSVDLSGDGKTIIVGAIGNNGGLASSGNNGQARVYRNTFFVSSNSWSWVILGAEINATAANVESGYDVSITDNGNTIAIGTPGQDKMRVYDLNVSNNWVQRGNGYSIFTSQSAQRAGHSVSINANGTVAAMGAPLANKVWVFDINPTGGTGLMSGNPLVVPGTYAGGSVDIDDAGNSLVVGAYKSNTETGSVVVYDFIGANWVQRGQTLSGADTYEQFGFDVSMSNDGNTIAVGSKGWDSISTNLTYEIGQTTVYDWDGSSWVQRGTSIKGVNIYDQCGYSVSLSGNGNRMAIGYKGNSTATQSAGLVRIFDWDGIAWVQNGAPIFGDGSNVYSGHSVALSNDGSILAIGAIQGTGPVNPFAVRQGQVRIYEGPCLVSSVAVTKNNDTLTAVANASYQWLDCNNGNQPIPNATGQVFVAQNPGSYSVQITENGCTQTSACIPVLVSSVNDETIEKFYVYPNPTSNIITVNSHQIIQKIHVLNVTGNSVLTFTNSNTADLSALASGLYYLALQFDNGSIGHLKILKQ
jgi:Secretion system C-terminal sorting domain/FG-GAP repeat